MMYNDSEDKNKKELAYDYLKEMIVNGELKPGALLVERQLCEILHTSRTPVREAIQKLSGEGLVETILSKGSFVKSITYEDISQIYDIREYLESLAVKLCCQNATKDNIALLRTTCDTMMLNLENKDIDQYFLSDSSFHKQLIRYSRNVILQNFYGTIFSQIRRITRMINYSLEDIILLSGYHKPIVEAIENNNSNQAEKVIREHISRSKLHHLKEFAPNIFNASNRW